MLIELADDLASPGTLDPAKWRHALANVALSHYEGKHFVLGSPHLLARLCAAESLDAAVRGRFKEIRDRVQDGHALRREAHVLLRVHASDSVMVTAEESAQRTIFNVGLLWFVDSGRAQATRLLWQAGAASVDVAVTHALIDAASLQALHAAGVGQFWSTDCVAHPSNCVPMASALAQALGGLHA